MGCLPPAFEMLFLTCSLLHFGLPYLAKGFVFPSAKIVIKLQWQNRNELLVPIRALQWYRLVRYAGTDSSAMLVPISALRWYRFKRYDGTVSPIFLQFNNTISPYLFLVYHLSSFLSALKNRFLQRHEELSRRSNPDTSIQKERT